MNIEHRWTSQFRAAYLWTVGVGVALTGGLFLGQGLYYHSVVKHTQKDNVLASNRERLWQESTGHRPIPDKGDSVDALASFLKPAMTGDLVKTDGLHAVPLPDAIATANLPASTIPDVTKKLDWCIFGVANKDGKCNTGGRFDSSFTAQVQDVLSGNLNAHLHQLKKLTYDRWSQWSAEDLLLWFLFLASVGYGVAVINDRQTTWTHWKGEYNKELDPQPGFPHLTEADRLTKAFLFTSPLAVAVTFKQEVPMRMWHIFSDRKAAAKQRTADEIFLSEHPKADALIEARDVLADLKALDPKFHEDPDIKRALKFAQDTVVHIEEIPEMIELDKARIEATQLVRRLLPVKEDVDDFADNHKQLMAEYHNPDMQRALKGLPRSPQPAKAEIVSDEELNRFINEKQ